MQMKKHFISANEFQIDCFELAHMIHNSDFIPDVVVGVWRGGSTPAVAIHEYLKYKGHAVSSNVLITQSYTGIGKQSEDVKVDISNTVLQELRIANKILLVDDVVDSGNTICAILAFLKQQQVVSDIQIASVYYKPTTSSIAPHFYIHESSEWIVFPHELEGLTPSEIRKKESFIDKSVDK